MIFDTHAHYDDHRYDEDREEVLRSLLENRVGRVTNIGADMESVKTTVALSNRYDFIYAAIGVHPDYTADLTEADMTYLKDCVQNPENKRIVAIGEIGLDYFGEEMTPKDIQKKWFIRQLELANTLKMPAVIHSRDAAQDTYDILREVKPGDGECIVHCFSYPKEMAKRFLDLGYYIALGGVTTFKNGRNAKEVAAYVPDDRLLIETDCPYLSPAPHRGERNDSGKLRYVVQEIAALRNTTEAHIEEITWKNACRFYRIEE